MNRIALATVGVLAGLAGATAFLCVQPEAAVSHAARSEAARQAVIAVDTGSFAPRANRHAGDALRIAREAGEGAGGEGLGWEYVQLRL